MGSAPSISVPPRKRSVVEMVAKAQPFHILLAGLVPGFFLIFASLILHLDRVTARAPTYAPIDREVGYLAALNWSVGYAVLLPLLLFLMTVTISGLAKALHRLHVCNMIRTPDYKPAPTVLLTEAWYVGNKSRKLLMVAFAGIIPALFACGEWFFNNFLRLMQNPSGLAPWNYDWGLTGIMRINGLDSTLSHRLANAAFDLAAFVTEGILLASLMAFFIAIMDLGRILPSGQVDESPVLLPDLEAQDERLGFEVFEAPLENLLAVALVAYLMCYLIRLEGAYLASKSAGSLADFVTDEILKGVTQAAKAEHFKDGLAEIFKTLFSLKDIQLRGMLAWLMSVFLAVFSMTAVLMTVKSAAQAAKENARTALQQGLLNLTADKAQAALKRLEKMEIWPFGYMRLDVLLFWIAVAVATLLLYRVGLFVAGFVLFTLFVRLLTKIVKTS